MPTLPSVPTRHRRLRRRVLVLLAVVALVAGPVAARAYWSGFTSGLAGTGVAGAAWVKSGATPSVIAVTGTATAVAWGASALSSGTPVDGYLVRRYDAVTSALQTTGAGCSGVIDAGTCVELGVPPGSWRYTVTPILGTAWRGAESVRSGAISVGAATLTLDRTVFGAPLPVSTTGRAGGFAPGEPLSYTVGGAATTGSPTTADLTGSAVITGLSIPARADGPTTVRVTGGTSGLVASAGALVDRTPPVIGTSVTPAPNAAGWNRTPVEVARTIDDASGSGLDVVRYTVDGSDPRTSPTALDSTGEAVPLATTTTVRYVGTDLAGNATPVLTLPVRIDTIAPTYAPAMVDVAGGAFVTSAPPHPGVAYYRGVAPGSFRFRIAMSDTGGSGPASLATSSLINVETGFTHLPGTGPIVDGVAFTNPFAWTAGTTSSPIGTVTVTDVAGNTTTSSGALFDDSDAPFGGSVDATGLAGTGERYARSPALSLVVGRGTDGASGLTGGGPADPRPDLLLRATAPLGSGDGIADGDCGSYGAFAQVGGDGPVSPVADVVPEGPACYRYRSLVSDHVGNVAVSESPDVKVVTAASAALRPSQGTISPLTGIAGQAAQGSTLYYDPTQAGTASVDVSASSPDAGVDHVVFPAPAGFVGGGAVATPVTGSVFRATYSWAAGTAGAPTGPQAVQATDHAGGVAENPAAFSFVPDATTPSGGSVGVANLTGTGGRYSRSTSLSVVLVAGGDTGAGLAPAGRLLRRASAALTSDGSDDGSCGTFGPFVQVGAADPASPRIDVVPVDGTCYRYRYLVPDGVGNVATYTSADVKVQSATPPAPVLAFSALTNASVTGTTVFYRPGAASGGFTVEDTSLDLRSGTVSSAFPALPTGWTGTAAGARAHRYTWDAANPTVPSGTHLVTTTNNAGGQSSASFAVAVTSDATAPTGGTVSTLDGYSTNPTINVSFTKGTDAGSGLNAGSGLLQRSSATLSGGTCGTFGTFATVATNPTSPYADPVTTGCQRYRYLMADNVGNQATYTTTSVVKVDQLPPTNTVSLSGATGAYSAYGGAVLYFKGDAPGSFRYVDALADLQSGPASVDFFDVATAGWTHPAETSTTPAGGPYVSTLYSWTAGAATPTMKSITGHDVAGKIWAAEITFQNDVLPPAGTSVSSPNGLVLSAAVPVSVVTGVDATSGVDPATTLLKRDVAPLDTTTQTCGTFPGTYATTVTLVGGLDPGTASGSCYRYRYTVRDRVGNAVTVTSPNVTKVDTSGPRVTAISSLQSSGAAGNGVLEVNDRLVLTFNQSLDAATVPTTFTGATETSPGFLQTVVLAIPGITDGPISTGSILYVPLSSTTTFGGTATLVNGGTATTLSIRVTSRTGATPTAGSGAMSFRPARTIRDGGGNAASGVFTTSSGFRLF